MKNKIRLVVIFVLILSASCTSNLNSKKKENKEARKRFESFAHLIPQKSDWMSCDVYLYGRDWEMTYHPSYCYKDGKQAFYLYHDESSAIKITDKAYFSHSNDNNTLEEYKHSNIDSLDCVYRSYKATFENRIRYLSVLFQSPMKQLQPSHWVSFTDVRDTVINGTKCCEIMALTPKSHWSIGKEIEGDEQQLCHFWMNCETGMPDSLVMEEILDTTRTHIDIVNVSCVVKNINFEDKENFFDSIFDFEADRYSRFSFRDEYSMFGSSSSIDTATEALLKFPIVSLDNDTTCLYDKDGFVLLNFWGIGCPPCMKNLQRYKQQTDSLGYRILEKEGVTIMAINYQSNNMEKLGELADKTSTRDIMYSAKEMQSLIKLDYIGYYYLLSPDKKLIYETSNLGDYSELLKAKETWEKQHPNYETK